jgi:pentatricopeptide repeat protein
MMMESMKKVSIILFESGNVLICAFCNGNDFTEAFKFITSFTEKHWSLIWTPNKKEKKTATKEKSVSRKRGHFDYGSYLVLK